MGFRLELVNRGSKGPVNMVQLMPMAKEEYDAFYEYIILDYAEGLVRAGNAHPDLAGKLAQAKRLTAESTSEQASAGLDALTDEERDRFTRLNAAYVEKHGFPFIIAVRDHDKPGIMAAFERRIGNDTETEFAEACKQVERIARIRLEDML